MCDWDGGHMDDGWGIVMVLGMVGLWVAVVAALVIAIVWAKRANGPTSSSSPVSRTGSAEQSLAERFARGEIDADEYRSRLDTLNARSTP